MCIFCKIVNKKIPSYKVLDTNTTYAFLDINPATYGHIVVIPKNHTSDFLEMNDEDTKAMMVDLKALANHALLKLNATGINIESNIKASAGQEVFHTHFHIIPRYDDNKINDEKNNFEEVLKKLI